MSALYPLCIRSVSAPQVETRLEYERELADLGAILIDTNDPEDKLTSNFPAHAHSVVDFFRLSKCGAPFPAPPAPSAPPTPPAPSAPPYHT